MSFYSKDIFTAALHITEPWYISSVNFDPDQKRLDVEVDFKRGSEFTIIGDFGIFTGKAYDTRHNQWIYPSVRSIVASVDLLYASIKSSKSDRCL